MTGKTIQQLKDTPTYRSFLDIRTGDVIMQANDDDIGWLIDDYSESGFWEVIVRGSFQVDAKHIDCKKQVVSALRGYTEIEVDNLFEERGEETLDGILRDYASADIRESAQAQFKVGDVVRVDMSQHLDVMGVIRSAPMFDTKARAKGVWYEVECESVENSGLIHSSRLEKA